MRTLILLFLTLGYAAQADAQALYRCGKQYQDRPCDPAPATVHGPGTAPSGPTSESLENRTARQNAEGERTRAYGNYECARYDQEIRNIYASQDLGSKNMDSLNTRARQIDDQRKRAGCG